MECSTFATIATKYFCIALFQAYDITRGQVLRWDRVGCNVVGSMKQSKQGAFVNNKH